MGVCKVMFLNTISISTTVVINAIKKQEHGRLVEIDKRGQQTPSNKTPIEIHENVIPHINSVPKYISHYSRAKTNNF